MLRTLFLIAALLRLLGRAWTAPHTAVTGNSISAADHNSKIRDNLNHLYNNLPLRPYMFHHVATVLAGNAIGRVIVVTQTHNHSARQNPAADADSFEQSFVAGAGTYTLHILGTASTDRGKIDWYLDDVSIATGQDWYAASLTPETEKTVASVVISEGGRHVLKGTVNGKNASSSSYVMNLTCYWFVPASE